jgi:hypothetical protein
MINIIVYYLFYFEDNRKYNTYNTNNSIYLISDSHGESLKDYIEIGGVYNFSFESDSYADIEKKLNFLIKESRIKKIIISIDSHCFSDYREKIDNHDKSIYYQSIFSGNLSYYENIKNKYIRYYFPVFNNNSPTLIKVEASKKINEFKGNSRDTLIWYKLNENDKSKESKRRLGVQFKSNNYSKKMIESFHRIISLANSNGIEVIAIKFPITYNYFNHLTEINKFQNLIDKEILKCENVKILDFQKIYFEHDEFFKDADHLNDIGAKQFSKLLIERLSNNN